MRRNKSHIRVIAAGYIIILFSLCKPVQAQEEFVSPPARMLTAVPIELLTGGIIILRATLDNYKDSLNFVLDTGSSGISLDSFTCSYFHLKTEQSDKTVRGIAGMKQVSFTYNHTLNLPGLSVNNLDFHINDYDILTSAYGIRIDGIIGYSFLRRYIITVDYDSSLMHVYTPGTIKYPKGGYLLRPQFSTIPMQALTIRDERSITAKYFFDIGAGLCMLLNEDLVQDSSLFRKKRKLYPTAAEGLGGKKNMFLTVIREMRLGPYRFRNVPVFVFDDAFNITSYPVLGGLIGNDILRRFNLILNYPEQQIYLKPNKHFLDSFDYSYSGLGMYLIDGVITVTDIMEKSPAAEAGFMPGDIVVGVENNLSGNIQQYKIMLQNPGYRMKVIIMRKNELKELYIKVKSIL